MAGNETGIAELLETVEGEWEGEETLVMGPDQTVTAFGRFVAKRALNGAGFTSDYTQSVDDRVSLACQTTYRIGPDSQVLMTWTPSRGDPQVFSGEFKERVIHVSRIDDQGMTNTIISDYSDPRVARIKTTIASESLPEMTEFSAEYTLR